MRNKHKKYVDFDITNPFGFELPEMSFWRCRFSDGGAGDGGEGGTAPAEPTGGEGTQTDPNTPNDPTKPTEPTDPNDPNDPNGKALDKLIQQRVDRLMAAERKEKAALQKKYDKLAKEKMTAEELQAAQAQEREAALQAREKELADKENRITAIKEMKAAGLDDGSDTSLELVDFIIAGDDVDEAAIKERVTSLNGIITKMVQSKVDAAFKANGRNPQGGQNTPGDGKNDSVAYAEKIGKARAEQQKQSQDILKMYFGG